MRFLMIFLCMLIFTCAFHSDPTAGWSEGFVRANGVLLHYVRTGGDKPVVLFLHDLTEDSRCWFPVAKMLQDSFDVIMLDFRNHGASQAGEWDCDLETLVEDIWGVINQLGIRYPVICGRGRGASTAIWFAALFPDIPCALVVKEPEYLAQTAVFLADSLHHYYTAIQQLIKADQGLLSAYCAQNVRPDRDMESIRYGVQALHTFYFSSAFTLKFTDSKAALARVRAPVYLYYDPDKQFLPPAFVCDVPDSLQLHPSLVRQLFAHGQVFTSGDSVPAGTSFWSFGIQCFIKSLN